MENINNRLSLVFGDVTLGVYGEKLSVIFSYARGGMESLKKDGMEWLYRTPLPCFWRATTDNDRGNGFPHRAAMWMGADSFIRTVGVEVQVDGKEIPLPIAPENNRYTDREQAECVRICFTYETNTNPTTNVKVVYEVIAPGDIHILAEYQGKEGLPELPVFGIRFVMPTKAEKFVYEGLSGETYPDRMAGGIRGVYEVEGLPVTPYLVPQDCGVHMQTKWVTVHRSKSMNPSVKEEKDVALTFVGEEEFAFSCLPYTPLELENATHHEELPPARRTILSVLGAVRGVGGIDSWGSDVEPEYHIPGNKTIRYSFWIKG